jgi:Ca-activated chloride channel family protein
MIDALREMATMFAWPGWLLAAPLPWLLARWRGDAGAGEALRLPIAGRIAQVVSGVRGAAPPARPGLVAALVWALLCLAAARPQQLGDPVQPPVQGRDLTLALDLSGSMSEPDMELGGAIVDRLTAAKAVLSDFIDRRAGDRLSLVVFGREAYVLTPPTADRETVREQLGDSVVGLAGQETAIGDAIGLATRRLREQESGQRVLVLLTDGVNTAGTLDPIKAARIAADEGVRIHTVAFGGDGTMSLFGLRLPMPGGDYADPTVLRDVAAITGGRFFRAKDTAALAGIYAEIDRIEPVARAGRAVRPRIERYWVPLGLALATVLAGAAGAWWRRR